MSAVDQAYLDYGRILTRRRKLVDWEQTHADGYNYKGPLDYLTARLFNYMGLTAGFYFRADDWDNDPTIDQLINEWALVSLAFTKEQWYEIDCLVMHHLYEYGHIGEWRDPLEDRIDFLRNYDDV